MSQRFKFPTPWKDPVTPCPGDADALHDAIAYLVASSEARGRMLVAHLLSVHDVIAKIGAEVIDGEWHCPSKRDGQTQMVRPGHQASWDATQQDPEINPVTPVKKKKRRGRPPKVKPAPPPAAASEGVIEGTRGDSGLTPREHLTKYGHLNELPIDHPDRIEPRRDAESTDPGD